MVFKVKPTNGVIDLIISHSFYPKWSFFHANTQSLNWIVRNKWKNDMIIDKYVYMNYNRRKKLKMSGLHASYRLFMNIYTCI